MEKRDVERLFREVGPRVWRAVYGYAGGRRDVADEAVAEAFARAIHHAGAIRDPGAWLYRTALRVAGRDLKRELRDQQPLGNPASDLAHLDARHDLLVALQQLSPNQRLAVILVHVDDRSVAEAATFMGVAAPTVRVHLFRARRRLRQLLEERADD